MKNGRGTSGVLWGLAVFIGSAQALSSAVAFSAPLHLNPCAQFFAAQQSASPTQEEQVRSQEAQAQLLLSPFAKVLGIYQDPFAFAFSLEEGQRIFSRLSFRFQNGKKVLTRLGEINSILQLTFAENRPYDSAVVQTVLDGARALLQKKNASVTELQTDFLALQYTLEYLRRFKAPDAVVVDRDGKPSEPNPEQKKPSPKKEKKEDASPPEDTPPEYPDLPNKYKPFTKDTDGSPAGGSQKKHRIAEVNFKTPFFAQRYFSAILRGAANPFEEVDLPGTPPAVGRFRQTDQQMRVRTFGKKEVRLFVPPHFKPLQPSDPRATVRPSKVGGGYWLRLEAELEEVQIPLVEETGLVLMPPVLDAYLRPVGIRADEWPEEVQAALIRKFSADDGRRDRLRVAQAIADHLASRFLYSVGARGETDPVEALRVGRFQCDMAAFAMVALLRDTFGIPSRVVGGFRAKSFQGGRDGRSYLVVPGEAHAWVEVFEGGQWHLFDPTPVKKDRKQEGLEKSEYADNALENTLKPEEEESAEEESAAGEASDAEEQGQDAGEATEVSEKPGDGANHAKRLDEATQARIDALKKAEGKAEGKTEGKTKDGDADAAGANDSDSDLTRDELADQLELGSLELEPTPDRNPLLERAVRVLFQIALDPTQSGSQIQNKLHALHALMKLYRTSAFQKLYQEALAAHAHEHPDLQNWIDSLLRRVHNQDLSKTYQELFRIHKAVEVYSKVLDREGRSQIPFPAKLLDVLARAQAALRTLAHPEAGDIALVQDLVKNLPAVVRQLIKNDFDFDSAGPNAPTRALAKQLKAGKLKDLRLLSILSPMADFILNSTPRPESIEIKAWERDAQRPRGRDLWRLERWSEMARALLGQPGKSLEENIAAATAFVPARRRRILIPAGYGKEDAERVTIVLYDTSGSMSGGPGRFQAGLIAAFTGKALSDLAPSGRHRHRVLIVPFDSNVGQPVPVTNTAGAIEVIRHYQQKLKNTNGGTDIQKALLQALALIADAEKRAGEPLAAANIVLMTDGQAELQPEALAAARKAIDRKTPLQTMFIAINNTNEELMRFAMDSQNMGMERGFYREFSAEHITDILKEADAAPRLQDTEGAFYSEKKASDLPREFEALLEEALVLSAEFSQSVLQAGRGSLPSVEHLKNIEQVRWRNVQQVARPLEEWLLKLRRLITTHPLFEDKRVLERVLDDAMTHLERLTGVRVDEFSQHEQEQLRHLLRFAAGLEASGWESTAVGGGGVK